MERNIKERKNEINEERKAGQMETKFFFKKTHKRNEEKKTDKI